MPIGLELPMTGLAGFAAVKLIGYSAVAHRMKRADPDSKAHYVTVGLFRTVLGVAVGAAYGFGVGAGLIALEEFRLMQGLLSPILFYAGLFPVRLLEWEIVLRLFFPGLRKDPAVAWRWRLTGTGWSYVLDIPAMFGLFATGRMWIC